MKPLAVHELLFLNYEKASKHFLCDELALSLSKCRREVECVWNGFKYQFLRFTTNIFLQDLLYLNSPLLLVILKIKLKQFRYK